MPGKRYLKFFNWPGSKVRVLPWLLPKFEIADRGLYVEPFLGSGNVWLNVPEKFSQYILNDKVPYVIRFFKAMADVSCRVALLEQLERLRATYPVKPSPKLKQKIVNHAELTPDEVEQRNTLKQSYYNLRDKWNGHRRENLNNAANLTWSNAAFAYLCGACINNLVRFGSNGNFNQGWGQRELDLNSFGLVADRVAHRNNRTWFHTHDFNSLLSNISVRGLLSRSVVYLDPPYGTRSEARVNGLYGLENSWTAENDQAVMAWCLAIHKADGLFVLSNLMENPGVARLIQEFNVQVVPIKYKASVGRHEVREQTEVIISNF